MLSWLILPADCLGVSALLPLRLHFHCIQHNRISPHVSERRTRGIREDGVKWRIFSLQVNSLLWQIKIMNGGQLRRLILHIVTHGSRCVVSAWIPVSNYLSASAHWCHSFPVITQSPACQGQVTSRWAWLVLDWDPHSAPLPLQPQASRHNLSASGLFVHLHRVMVVIGPLETTLLVIAPLRQHYTAFRRKKYNQLPEINECYTLFTSRFMD